MRKLTLMAALAAATTITSPAFAGDAEGRWQVKVLATGVLPDGKITKVESDPLSLLRATDQSKLNDNYVPTLAVEYFASPNISIETICCLTKHKVTGAGTLAGAALVNDVLVLPATVTLKYHLQAGPIKPYVGVGPSLFLIMGEKPGSTAQTLGVTRVKMSNELGVALQAGVDIPVNDQGLGISLDAKRYFINTTARFYTANGTEALRTKHRIDPWVLSAGVAYRF